MMAAQDTPLLQADLNHQSLNNERLADHIVGQWQLALHLESAIREGKPLVIRKLAAGLDLAMLRYALSTLRFKACQAAVEDCATLITARVLDTDPAQFSLARFEAWLTAAACWPTLACDAWSNAREEASNRVIRAFNESETALGKEEIAALDAQIKALQISDLITDDLARRLRLRPSADGDVDF